jgi:ketosteroid isomerase-like protein
MMLLAAAATMAAADFRQELLEADRAFDRATAERGLDGWMSFFAEDAQLNTPAGPLRGKAALREHYSKMFAQKDFSIRWTPYHSESSTDGTLGFTLGTAVISWTDDKNQSVKRNGRYLTVWRRMPDGNWRAVTDIGN